MKLISKRWGGGRYQNRIFLLLLLVSVVPLLLVGFVSYRIYTEEMTKQSDLSMEAIKIQLSSDVESILSNIRQYYLESAEKEELKWLMETDSIPYQEYSYLYDAQKVLSGPTYLTGYVGNYAFINIKLGWVLTNKGMYPLNEVRNGEQVWEFIDSVRENPSTLYWYNKLHAQASSEDGLYRSNTLDVNGMWMVLKLPGTTVNMNYLLMAQLNLTTVSQQLNKSLAGYEVCIINRDGELVFSSDSSLADYCVNNGTLINDNGSIRNVTVDDDLEYRILVSNISNNGMIYAVAYDLSNVQEGADKILYFTMLLILVLILVLIVCWIFTSILYQPLRNLTTYVSEAGGESPGGERDEFSFITENVVSLIHTKDSLQQMVNEQRKMLIEQFMIRTIRGELTPEAINKTQERFSLNKARVYRLMTVVTTLERETNQESELESEAFLLTIVKQIPQALVEEFLIVAPFCYNDQIMLLIGEDTEEALSVKSVMLHSRMMEFVETNFGCSIISGVSQIFHRFKYIRKAWNECTEAQRNTKDLSLEHSDIAFFEDISRNENIEGYDFVIEISLIKAIDNASQGEAEQMIDRFVNSLYNRGISGHNRNFYIYRLVTAVLALLSDAGLSVNNVFTEETEDIFHSLNYILEAEQLKSYLYHRVTCPTIEALKRYRYNESSDILRKIMEIVKESKGNVTMTECAEQLNYHPSYIWKILKAERNMTFTDLITLEKLEAAKSMLTRSEVSIADIAEQLNYSNTQNFIRFFSKYEKMTPGNYRKQYREGR